MSRKKDWATVVTVSDIFTSDAPPHGALPDPRNLLETLSGNALLPIAPSEVYSEKVPALTREESRDDFLPIDRVLGEYDPRRRKITIFIKAIESHSASLDCDPKDLEFLVRCHEFAHAIVHLGVRATHRADVTKTFGKDGATDTRRFLRARNARFRRIGDQAHEMLAQALTLSAVRCLDEPNQTRLVKVFEVLENRQPKAYRLSQALKAAIPPIRWAVVLGAARAEQKPRIPPDLALADALESLICVTREPASTEPEAQQWVVTDDGSLAAALASEIGVVDGASSGELIEFLVPTDGPLKVEIFSDEHPPPHFRVSVQGGTANYRITDGVKVNGGLQRYHRQIRKFYEANREKLIAIWNERRPSDCPVGPIRLAPRR